MDFNAPDSLTECQSHSISLLGFLLTKSVKSRESFFSLGWDFFRSSFDRHYLCGKSLKRLIRWLSQGRSGTVKEGDSHPAPPPPRCFHAIQRCILQSKVDKSLPPDGHRLGPPSVHFLHHAPPRLPHSAFLILCPSIAAQIVTLEGRECL